MSENLLKAFRKISNSLRSDSEIFLNNADFQALRSTRLLQMHTKEIVLVDYKTDRVKRGQEQKLINLYHVQLEDYAQALERMTGKRVKEKIIYSFTLQKEILL